MDDEVWASRMKSEIKKCLFKVLSTLTSSQFFELFAFGRSEKKMLVVFSFKL